MGRYDSPYKKAGISARTIVGTQPLSKSKKKAYPNVGRKKNEKECL